MLRNDRIVKPVFCLLFLTGMLCAQVLPQVFLHSDNPAGRAGDVFGEWSLRLEGLSGRDNQQDTGRLTAFWMTPTPEGPRHSWILDLQHQGDVRTSQTRLSLRHHRAWRMSAEYYLGGSAGLQYNHGADKAGITLTPGVVWNYGGNFRVRFHTTGTLAADRDHDEWNPDLRLDSTLGLLLIPTSRWLTELSLTSRPGISLRGMYHNGSWGLELGSGWFREEEIRLWVGLHWSDATSFFSLQGQTSHKTSDGAVAAYGRRMGFWTSHPVDLDSGVFPVRRKGMPRFGLSMSALVGDFQPDEIEIEIQRGDNLLGISKRLPPEVMPQYHNNVRAISEYNGIDNPSRIYVGQILKVPVRKITHLDSLLVPDPILALGKRIIHDILSSQYREIAVNRSLWRYRTEDWISLRGSLPSRGGLDDPYWLNARAIVAMHEGNSVMAIRYLDWALEILPDEPVLHANLGLACFSANQTHRAYEHLRFAWDHGVRSRNVVTTLIVLMEEANAADR